MMLIIASATTKEQNSEPGNVEAGRGPHRFGPESIEIHDVVIPEPGPGQVLIKVAAAAANPIDLGVASGSFHELRLVRQPNDTGLGWDYAGTVAAGTGRH